MYLNAFYLIGPVAFQEGFVLRTLALDSVTRLLSLAGMWDNYRLLVPGESRLKGDPESFYALHFTFLTSRKNFVKYIT